MTAAGASLRLLHRSVSLEGKVLNIIATGQRRRYRDYISKARNVKLAGPRSCGDDTANGDARLPNLPQSGRRHLEGMQLPEQMPLLEASTLAATAVPHLGMEIAWRLQNISCRGTLRVEQEA